MAENSLFAILLRARWWISFAIAAAVALVSAALFPKEIAPFAALAAFPFFVVGCVAAWRQLQAPSPAKLEQIQDVLRQQSWADFCTQLESAWKTEGYEVQRVNTAGVDLLLSRNGQTTAVNAKRWKAATHGVEPLRELKAAADKLEAGTAVYVAMQALGDNASAFAAQQGIVVMDGRGIATLLAKTKA